MNHDQPAIELNYTFDYVPSVMKRGKHVLIVIKDENGKYVLGSKKIYPDGIYRFIGGGMDENTKPIHAAIRELQEETGIQKQKHELQPITTITATIVCHKEKTIFTTYLFFTKIEGEEIQPASDLDGIIRLDEKEMQKLIDRYQNLSTKPTRITKNYIGQLFRWSDYGKLYAEIHKLGLEKTKNL